MPIEDIKPYFPRLGRITAGYTTVKRTQKGPIVVPTKSETFVFSSDDRERLEVVAEVLGGTVEPSPDPRSEGRFRCITRACEVEVLLPCDDERGWDSWYELWGQGGCLRRCTGITCQFAIDPQTGERREWIPCMCKAQGLQRTDPNHCRPVSRLNVVVPVLKDAPGLGVWQVTSRGISTYLSIQAAVDLARRFGPISGVPLLLRIITNRRVDRVSGEVRKFPTIIVTVKESYVEAFRRRQELRIPVEALPLPDREAPPLGAYLTPEQAAAAEEDGEELFEPQAEELPADELEGIAEEPVEVELEDLSGPPVQEPEEPPPSTARRDYTEFWRAVRAAARAEGLDPHEWLRRNAGTDDPRKLDDRGFGAALRKARGEKPAVRPLPEARAETETIGRPIDPGLAARMAEQLRARARAKGLTDEQLADLVREAGDVDHVDLAEAIAARGYGLFNAVFRRIG